MISRKARAALRKARQGKTNDYVGILREGGRAAQSGLPLFANPYASGTEDHETWAEGHADWLLHNPNAVTHERMLHKATVNALVEKTLGKK